MACKPDEAATYLYLVPKLAAYVRMHVCNLKLYNVIYNNAPGGGLPWAFNAGCRADEAAIHLYLVSEPAIYLMRVAERTNLLHTFTLWRSLQFEYVRVHVCNPI